MDQDIKNRLTLLIWAVGIVAACMNHHGAYEPAEADPL